MFKLVTKQLGWHAHNFLGLWLQLFCVHTLCKHILSRVAPLILWQPLHLAGNCREVTAEPAASTF